MKKRLNKFINLILAIMIIITTCSVMTTAASAANYTCTMTLEELQTLFEDGKYWNHVGLKSWDITTTTSSPCTSTHAHGNCKYNGSCGCNSYKGKCLQCMGFVYALQDLAFNGFDGYDAAENWNYFDAMSKIKPGDVIRYYNGGEKHSIFVTKVDGETITFMDCNGTGGGCIIRHNQTISKSSLKSVFLYATHAPTELKSNGATRVNLFETATVTARTTLTIRQQPNIHSASVGSLKSGATVNICNYPITDSSGYTWRLLVDGRGWVCDSYLEVTSGQAIVSGTYKIQYANGKYLSYTSSPTNDVNIVMYEDLSGTDLADLQLWNFTPLFAYSDYGAIVYRITPVLNSNYSLDCDSTDNQLLHLWESLDIGAQQWIIEVRTDGSLRILNNATRLALDVYNGNSANNTEVITYTSHNGTPQQFFLVAP